MSHVHLVTYQQEVVQQTKQSQQSKVHHHLKWENWFSQIRSTNVCVCHYLVRTHFCFIESEKCWSPLVQWTWTAHRHSIYLQRLLPRSAKEQHFIYSQFLLFILTLTSLSFHKKPKVIWWNSSLAQYLCVCSNPINSPKPSWWSARAPYGPVQLSILIQPWRNLRWHYSKVERVQRLLLHHRLQLHLCQRPLLSHMTQIGQFSCLSADCFVLFASFTSVSLHCLMENPYFSAQTLCGAHIYQVFKMITLIKIPQQSHPCWKA